MERLKKQRCVDSQLGREQVLGVSPIMLGKHPLTFHFARTIYITSTWLK